MFGNLSRNLTDRLLTFNLKNDFNNILNTFLSNLYFEYFYFFVSEIESNSLQRMRSIVVEKVKEKKHLKLKKHLKQDLKVIKTLRSCLHNKAFSFSFRIIFLLANIVQNKT